MFSIPNTIEAATEQAQAATQAAIQAGLTRLQIEMVIPELKQQPIAEQFLAVFQELGLAFKVYFADAGAAALAKRDWDNPDFSIRGINEIKGQPDTEDEAFLVINPSAVEVSEVEKLCEAALDRPVVLLNPKLEDVATIGIGYAGRQLRERFLSKLESCYYLRPLEGAAIFRCYPQPWQVWQETESGDYTLLSEFPQRPTSEAIERILSADTADQAAGASPKRGFLGELQQFIRALTQ
ncbi:MAG: DUF1995 family protein [Leptolyngbya sp. SIO4C1]|nr:DUF1995 family protein [Leptolyngbya sp. SIO4C1]